MTDDRLSPAYNYPLGRTRRAVNLSLDSDLAARLIAEARAQHLPLSRLVEAKLLKAENAE